VDDLQKAAPDQLVFGIVQHGAQRRVDRAETQVEPGHGLAERTLLEHAAKPLFAVAQRGLGQLAAGDVDVDATMADRFAGGVADDAAAAEDPVQFAVGADDTKFGLDAIRAAGQRVLEVLPDAIPIVGMVQATYRLDRHRLCRRLEPHNAEEQRTAAQHACGHVEVPGTDPGGLRESEDLALTEGRPVVDPIGHLRHCLDHPRQCYKQVAVHGMAADDFTVN
jgi:hypothetical protein